MANIEHECMTQEARKLQKEARDRGDMKTYHALQSLTVQFGYKAASNDNAEAMRLANLLAKAYRAQLWFHKGPYGPSPQETDMEDCETALMEYFGDTR